MALSAVSSPALAGNTDPFGYKGWHGWAYVPDGEFRHCVVTGRYSNGTAVSFFYDDQGFKLAVNRRDWNLDTGMTYGVRVAVNPGLVGRVPAVPAGSTSLLMSLAGLDRPIYHIRRGYTLNLQVEGLDRMTFDLTGTSVVLERLLACYRRNDT